MNTAHVTNELDLAAITKRGTPQNAMRMTDRWRVKPGDRVRRGGAWSGWDETNEVGEVLAVLPVPGRSWPDVVVTLPRGQVETWHRWGKVTDEEGGQ